MDVWDNKYACILADPPWDYQSIGFHGYKGVKYYDIDSKTQYKTMTIPEIVQLPVRRIADDKSHLYLWVTTYFMDAGIVILNEWGFNFRGILTWVKKPRLGMGYYYRNCTEFVLFGVKGNLRTLSRSEPNYFEAPIGKHSEKPGIFYNIVERNSPPPRVELFARNTRLGWDSWGSEV